MDDELKEKIKSYFYDRAPNSLLAEYIVEDFGLSSRKVSEVLDDLCRDGFLEKREGEIKTDYKIKNLSSDYPKRKIIKVGKFEFPRLLAMDVARPEDLNRFIEKNAVEMENMKQSLHDKLIKKTQELEGKQLKQSITLLGVFTAIISFIIASIQIISRTVLLEALVLMVAMAFILIIFISTIYIIIAPNDKAKYSKLYLFIFIAISLGFVFFIYQVIP